MKYQNNLCDTHTKFLNNNATSFKSFLKPIEIILKKTNKHHKYLVF